MMESTREEARLNLIGNTRNILGLRSAPAKSPWERIKHSYETRGFLSALATLAGVGLVYGTLGLMALTIIAAFVIALVLLRAWVMVYLWTWFLVPIGVPQIGMANAVGISILFGFMCRVLFSDIATRDDLKALESTILNGLGKKRDDKKDGKKTLRRLATQFLSPLIALALGYVAHQYMPSSPPSAAMTTTKS